LFLILVTSWILVGGLAALFSSFPLIAFGYVLKETYLLFLFLCIVLALKEISNRVLFSRLWLGVALFEALAVIGLYVIARPDRSAGTFDDPNMAANYLALSLLLVTASSVNPKLKVLALPVLTLALLLTGSLGAVLALGVATFCWVILVLLRRPGLKVVALAAGLSAVLVALLWGYLLVPTIRITAPGSTRAVEVVRPLDHISKSIADHTRTIGTAFALWVKHPFHLGIGPGTLEYYEQEQGVGAFEAHNDLLASLLEKGLLGFLLLLAVWVVLFRQALKVATLGRFGIGLAFAVLVIFMQSQQIELIHWRQIWLVFAAVFGYSEKLFPAPGYVALEPEAPAKSPSGVTEITNAEVGESSDSADSSNDEAAQLPSATGTAKEVTPAEPPATDAGESTDAV
jgi:O-antigen ligase